MLSRLTSKEQKSEELGDRIFKGYVSCDLTREAFALVAGVSVEVVYEVIHGRAHGKKVTREDLLMILRAFRLLGFTLNGLSHMYHLVDSLKPHVDSYRATIILNHPVIVSRPTRPSLW